MGRFPTDVTKASIDLSRVTGTPGRSDTRQAYINCQASLFQIPAQFRVNSL